MLTILIFSAMLIALMTTYSTPSNWELYQQANQSNPVFCSEDLINEYKQALSKK